MRRVREWLAGNRGRHTTCQGHHWHARVAGWRCCGCSKTAPAGDRPAQPDGVVCRLPVQDGSVRAKPADLSWLNNLNGEDRPSAVVRAAAKAPWLNQLGREDTTTIAVPEWARHRAAEQ